MLSNPTGLQQLLPDQTAFKPFRRKKVVVLHDILEQRQEGVFFPRNERARLCGADVGALPTTEAERTNLRVTVLIQSDGLHGAAFNTRPTFQALVKVDLELVVRDVLKTAGIADGLVVSQTSPVAHNTT